jgi:hypothetical protein
MKPANVQQRVGSDREGTEEAFFKLLMPYCFEFLSVVLELDFRDKQSPRCYYYSTTQYFK